MAAPANCEEYHRRDLARHAARGGAAERIARRGRPAPASASMWARRSQRSLCGPGVCSSSAWSSPGSSTRCSALPSRAGAAWEDGRGAQELARRIGGDANRFRSRVAPGGAGAKALIGARGARRQTATGWCRWARNSVMLADGMAVQRAGGPPLGHHRGPRGAAPRDGELRRAGGAGGEGRSPEAGPAGVRHLPARRDSPGGRPHRRELRQGGRPPRRGRAAGARRRGPRADGPRGRELARSCAGVGAAPRCARAFRGSRSARTRPAGDLGQITGCTGTPPRSSPTASSTAPSAPSPGEPFRPSGGFRGDLVGLGDGTEHALGARDGGALDPQLLGLRGHVALEALLRVRDLLQARLQVRDAPLQLFDHPHHVLLQGFGLVARGTGHRLGVHHHHRRRGRRPPRSVPRLPPRRRRRGVGPAALAAPFAKSGPIAASAG